MTNKLHIVGAGHAGLLAANLLRRHLPIVFEKGNRLPSNHSAVFRFRSTSVSEATGIPFTPITVSKAIYDNDTGEIVDRPNIRYSNAYSQKVTGEIHRRSILNLTEEKRWVAPENFTKLMANGVRMEVNTDYFKDGWKGDSDSRPVISTIPMPLLMRALEYPDIPKFHYRSIYTYKVHLTNPHIYVNQTVYCPSESARWYRATLQGQELTLELTHGGQEFDRGWLIGLIKKVFGIRLADIGSSNYHEIPYGKITPIPDSVRKDFILWASERHNVYSLGRFATWRPGLLMDDLVKDIGLIDRMIFESSAYNRKLK